MNRIYKIEQIKNLLRPNPSVRILLFVEELDRKGMYRESRGPLGESCNNRTYSRAELDKIEEQGNVIVVEIIHPISETES